MKIQVNYAIPTKAINPEKNLPKEKQIIIAAFCSKTVINKLKEENHSYVTQAVVFKVIVKTFVAMRNIHKLTGYTFELMTSKSI